MSDEIPPALSAEEWQGRPVLDQERVVGWLTRSERADADVAVWASGERTLASGDVLSDPAAIHALMALANSALPAGDPRRLRRDMVTAIRAAAERAEAAGTPAPELRAAAAAIEALLPPCDARQDA